MGSAAVQVAKALGSRVIAVVSTSAKRAIAEQAGAGQVVLAEAFLNTSKSITGGRGVDVVLDPVGGRPLHGSFRGLAPEGRLLVGFTAGEIPTVKVNRLLLNNVDVDVVGVGVGAFMMREPALLQNEWTTLTVSSRRTCSAEDTSRCGPAARATDCAPRVELEPRDPRARGAQCWRCSECTSRRLQPRLARRSY